MNDLVYILVLAIVVTVHEFGHYFFARMMHVKVLRVQLFFFSWYTFKPKPSSKSFGKTSWRDTEYSIGWLPFGGYTSYAVTPYNSFRGRDTYYNTKPAWRRLMISIAGVLFNLITAILVYSLIIFVSDTGSSAGFMQSLSATFDFLFMEVSYTIAGIFSMIGMSFGTYTPSPANFELIQEFLSTSADFPFLMFVANLSVVLAIINILPIPPLDGGQAVFEIYEMITGREPSAGFKRGASIVGSIIFILVFWILPMINRI